MTIEDPVLLTAVTAEDYRYLNMPVLPNTIRRVALNEREMMLARRAGGGQTGGSNVMSQNLFSSTGQGFPASATGEYAAPTSTSRCSSCGISGASESFSAARYDADGNCMDTMCISCETKWRVRDCVKLAVCEFITCIASEVCADGSFRMPKKIDEAGNEVDKDFGEVLLDCLGGAMCTTLNCLPEAICGPRNEEACIPPPALECNFAVEEKN